MQLQEKASLSPPGQVTSTSSTVVAFPKPKWSSVVDRFNIPQEMSVGKEDIKIPIVIEINQPNTPIRMRKHRTSDTGHATDIFE